MSRQPEDAAAELARRRAAHLERVRKNRAKAALIVSGLTLDAEHVRALDDVKTAMRSPTRAAAIRSAIMFTAKAVARAARTK